MNKTHLFVWLRARIAPWLRATLEQRQWLRVLCLSLITKGIKSPVALRGHTIHLNAQEVGVGLELSMTGEYEVRTLDLVKEFLRPGMTFVDVGAHVGIYSLEGAKAVGPTGQVIAFEPDPENASFLRKNIEVNGYSNVKVLQKAVSRKNEKASLYRSNFNFGDHRLFLPGTGRQEIEVECTTLDTALHNEPRVHLIKIDVQGAEAAVLEGMDEIFDRFPSVAVLLELSPSLLRETGVNAQTLLHRFVARGMQLHFIDDAAKTITVLGSEEILQRCPDKSYVNVLCVKAG